MAQPPLEWGCFFRSHIHLFKEKAFIEPALWGLSYQMRLRLSSLTCPIACVKAPGVHNCPVIYPSLDPRLFHGTLDLPLPLSESSHVTYLAKVIITDTEQPEA